MHHTRFGIALKKKKKKNFLGFYNIWDDVETFAQRENGKLYENSVLS